MRAVEILKRAAGEDCLIAGWVDMPFAEACSVCGLSEFMVILMDDPALAHALLDFLASAVVDFAVAQVKAGADMIGAGDAESFWKKPRGQDTCERRL